MYDTFATRGYGYFITFQTNVGLSRYVLPYKGKEKIKKFKQFEKKVPINYIRDKGITIGWWCRVHSSNVQKSFDKIQILFELI